MIGLVIRFPDSIDAASVYVALNNVNSLIGISLFFLFFNRVGQVIHVWAVASCSG